MLGPILGQRLTLSMRATHLLDTQSYRSRRYRSSRSLASSDHGTLAARNH